MNSNCTSFAAATEQKASSTTPTSWQGRIAREKPIQQAFDHFAKAGCHNEMWSWLMLAAAKAVPDAQFDPHRRHQADCALARQSINIANALEMHDGAKHSRRICGRDYARGARAALIVRPANPSRLPRRNRDCDAGR